MSKNRTIQGTGFINPKKLEKGPGDRPYCRCGCRREVQKPRRSYFSADCVHQYKLKSDPGYLRDCVERRDHEVCAICGRDCRALFRELQKLHDAARRDYTAEVGAACQSRFEELAAEGFPFTGHWPGFYLTQGKLWQADHIIPVAEGGGECGLDNMRTLCTPCHKKVTAELRDRLRQSRALQGQGS